MEQKEKDTILNWLEKKKQELLGKEEPEWVYMHGLRFSPEENRKHLEWIEKQTGVKKPTKETEKKNILDPENRESEFVKTFIRGVDGKLVLKGPLKEPYKEENSPSISDMTFKGIQFTPVFKTYSREKINHSLRGEILKEIKSFNGKL